MKKTVIICLFFASAINQLFSQGIEMRIIPLKNYISLNIIPALTQINTQSSSFNSSSSGKIAIGGTINFGYMFSGIVGIDVGLGYSSYLSEVKLEIYNSKFNTLDSENENFEMRVSGNSIKETQKIGGVAIPLCLHMSFPFSNSMGMQINAGTKLIFLSGKTYSAKGVFSYQGYYPSHNVTLSNLPEYGFVNDLNLDKSGSLPTNSLTVNLMFNASYYYKISKKIAILVGCYYDNALSGISKIDNSEFQLSKNSENYNSMMITSTKSGITALGAQVSVQYFLK